MKEEIKLEQNHHREASPLRYFLAWEVVDVSIRQDLEFTWSVLTDMRVFSAESRESSLKFSFCVASSDPAGGFQFVQLAICRSSGQGNMCHIIEGAQRAPTPHSQHVLAGVELRIPFRGFIELHRYEPIDMLELRCPIVCE